MVLLKRGKVNALSDSPLAPLLHEPLRRVLHRVLRQQLQLLRLQEGRDEVGHLELLQAGVWGVVAVAVDVRLVDEDLVSTARGSLALVELEEGRGIRDAGVEGFAETSNVGELGNACRLDLKRRSAEDA